MIHPIVPLIEHDHSLTSTSDNLLTTLEGFLRHNGHIERAATELGVHRHTMRNRTAKISELTGLNLHSADTRAQLLLAIRARDLLAIDAKNPRC